MTRALASVAALALVACNCGDKLTLSRPELVVVKPTTKVGELWALDFGRVQVGGSYSLPIAIENRGRAKGTLTSIELRAESDPAFTLSGAEAPVEVLPGGTAEIRVNYAPLKPGELKPSYVDIVTDDPDLSRITVRLFASAEAGEIEVCAETAPGGTLACNVPDKDLSIDFGMLNLGATAMARRVRVKNVGALDLTYGGTVLGPGTSTEFSFDPPQAVPPSGLALAPGQVVEFQIRYRPIDGGVDTGEADVQSNDPDESVVRIQLRGGGIAPKLCAVPSPTLDFGSVVIGTTRRKSVKLSSCGTSPLTLSAASLVPGKSPHFTVAAAPTLPITLPVGGFVDVVIAYAPRAAAVDAGQLKADSSDPASPVTYVNLRGAGTLNPVCDIDVAPRQIDFGSVSMTGFAEASLTGVNVGQQPCLVKSFTLSGSSTFSITAAPGTPVSVSPNGVFTVKVRYKPTAAASDTGTLTIDSDDPAEPQIAVPLKGTGANPGPCAFQFVPNPIAFGQISVGTQLPQTLSMWNFGTSSCAVLGADMVPGSSSAFGVGSPMLPTFIGSNQKVDFTITFAPRSGGAHTGTIQIKAGQNFFSYQNFNIPVSGSAVSPTICVQPALLDFGSVPASTTKDLPFSVSSCGAGTLEVRGIQIDAGSSSAYSLPAPPNTPLVLAAGASTTVNVRYGPAQSGPDFGQVAIFSNDGASPKVNVRLRGNVVGTCDKVLACAPPSLTFPRTPVGQTSTLTFTCTNAGATDLTPTAIRLRAGTSNEFALAFRPVPPVLKSGDSIRVAVDYTPNAAGIDAGTAEIVSDDCRGTQAVSLSAEGVTPNYPPCIVPKAFSPVTRWSWSSPSSESSYNKVFGQPAVANLTDDNGDGRIDPDDTPDVVFPSLVWPQLQNPQNVDASPPGVLRAIHGKTGAEIWSITDPALRVTSTTQVAVADIDGDNKVEIVVPMYYQSPGSGTGGWMGKFRTGRLYCFEHDGKLKWTSDWWSRSQNEIEDGSGASIADLDADGSPEIVLGASAFDANGKLLWEGTAGQGSTGHGPISVVADLDGDGKSEVIAGNSAYRADGTVYWTYGASDGLSIVVDTDADGSPEIVLRTDSTEFVVLNSNGTKKHGPVTFASAQGACAAAISAADFDGDGRPELAVPAGDTFYLFKPDGRVMWQKAIDDYTNQCGASGASAFDFEGDGKYDAVYHDQNQLYVFSGANGTVIYSAPRYSATIWEVPVIADVDNDGHADILITQSSSPGLKLMNNSTNDWIATRRIWNQHTYHVSNIAESGAVPRVEGAGWRRFNAYRVNEPRCR